MRERRLLRRSPFVNAPQSLRWPERTVRHPPSSRPHRRDACWSWPIAENFVEIRRKPAVELFRPRLEKYPWRSRHHSFGCHPKWPRRDVWLNHWHCSSFRHLTGIGVAGAGGDKWAGFVKRGDSVNEALLSSIA